MMVHFYGVRVQISQIYVDSYNFKTSYLMKKPARLYRFMFRNTCFGLIGNCILWVWYQYGLE